MTIGVRYEGTTMNMNGVADSDGDIFMVGDIEGLDSMDVLTELVDHYGDGSAFGKGRYPKRELNIKGIGWAPGSVANGALRIRNKIEAWFADYVWNERWLYVDMPSPGTSVQFKTRPGGKLHFDPPVGNSQTFEIPLQCADPIKYGQTLEHLIVSGSTTVNNYGNFPTRVVATLNTTFTDPYIQNNTSGNQRLTLQGSIPGGSTVDFQARRTVKYGVGTMELASRPRVWWRLLPGANVITSNTAWTLDYHDAYR